MIKAIQSFDEYTRAYAASIADPEKYWDDQAAQFIWKKKWDKTLEWNFSDPDVKWFIGGKLNITENILDRHATKTPDKVAIHWESNNPDEAGKDITYKQLYEQVCVFAGVLKQKGIKKGDRVCIYMPMIPELAIAVLACARIGAIHSVIFAGFSASAVADRVNDAKAVAVLTSDGSFRGTKSIAVKALIDEALQQCETVKTVLVAKRTGDAVAMKDGRDYWWDEAIAGATPVYEAEEMDSEDPLFILYTSGSTGKPKGVVHTIGGYMVYTAFSFANVFQYNEGDVYFCTADIGWITGHSYLVYGPLLQGATQVMFEGIPTYPDAGRFWSIIDKYAVTHFYTAPTAIRSLMSFGDTMVEKYSLKSLKVLGSVGEPINEEAWHWFNEHIGKKNCPIVDTWWQTETGGILISPLASITPLVPSYATLPLPGVQPVLVDANGTVLEGNNVEGNLCMKFPWPSIIRTTYGDHERCKQTYFSTYPNLYFTGDGCKRDEKGYYRIMGRVDDVINVSGHRFGTAEIESAINEQADVIESAVVGYPHEVKGQGIYAYVICDKTDKNEDQLRKEILDSIVKLIGPIAKPDKIQIVTGLPKTRSGKIMRRILRKVAEGDLNNLGDTSTLLDPEIVEEIKKGAL
ncbi:acetate--CoA ligase [Cytophaga hutchinsonii]|uniref:Acetate--CoA ligase n=1 Tax=Cytophaga hutchinsonii (strain ATCC 33406 / DSM 1761 / CIP 103989 / NBRC 15051 / NCIMB 9469 / D465) TaxID=269798 RepID=A0A6N4STZ6_CYTH3|nr:acetate--CoA ligase [Cytophaga hutchinsonii]ABG59685.1 acetyl-coenzyme A synthetase [Cytophaga hutchinsonii ATCC 33406]SFX65977.1 acetyl-coenzyme A synthetase [Cytophaga hutchinsonii ATCC 33406]